MITNENSFQLLPESFYKQPTLTLAKQLIGKILVHETEEGLSSGVIVETEAYLGALDRAAHSYGYRRTKRTEIMYHQAGLIYTYQMHTHCLLNIVSGEVGEPEAVLIRAIEPYSGVDLMMQKRPVKKIQNLTSGPGKLTKALGITMQMYGEPIYKQPLYITEGARIDEIMTGPRIGIPNTEEARDYPYRFWMAGNSYVSR
ncbi:DNA-3-methyladenine glycosylase [Oceanobacillus alkalisoli]|uniref:DNA-3-methyladenine glycosylase n=1 Tax=Oceanobacillus alkalisoli TaxID=2925113 RepID=UPI001F02172B|nr:DNA-3-methyladenine glycosylase [Oceanobacillus alkalisoli]MCF3942346.1 DNA-3-methyladenine glycosylase [Oceanobacillus alkalisoli]